MVLNRGEFEQLPMFATARELHEQYSPADYHADAHAGDPANMWEEKHEDAWDTGLYHKVADEGVKKPVNVWHSSVDRELLNGHHRVAAAYDVDPSSLVPLNHTANPFENEDNYVPHSGRWA